MRRSTKGQIQIGETVAVIFVFMILLVFGLAWFASFSTAGMSAQRDKDSRLQLLSTTKEVMNMPEIACSSAGRKDQSCVDLYRVQSFADLIENDPQIAEALSSRYHGYAIRIDALYPPLAGGGSQTLFDFPPGPAAGFQEIAVPVIVHHPGTRENAFGMLVLRQYEVLA